MAEQIDRTELKLAFAASLLHHPHDVSAAAFAITNDTGLALQISRQWVTDPIVKAEQERLLSGSDPKQFLPTKEIQARAVYLEACNTKDNSCDERLKAHRLYAELMSYIEKPLPGNTTNILNQGVMIVKDAGTDDQWEKGLAGQQRQLIENGTVN